MSGLHSTPAPAPRPSVPLALRRKPLAIPPGVVAGLEAMGVESPARYVWEQMPDVAEPHGTLVGWVCQCSIVLVMFRPWRRAGRDAAVGQCPACRRIIWAWRAGPTSPGPDRPTPPACPGGR